ncbi:hypothetical protein IOC61_03295 [Halomonas sp. KAO]|uniref:hypothetical protein n=1 Tax=Halomonas sp. KAO TaxID=2783858 RepID=UPI00189F5F76|nr:hypothetical protein [Halomonas sp. KAO]MBF7052341.1 hypothetical protein [Halomonas sp. KAO]
MERNTRSDTSNELSRDKSEIHNIQERLHVVKDRIQEATIRFPVDGIDGLHNGGIRLNDVLMEEVPKSASLVVEARVLPSDIDVIEVGMLADPRFPGFKAASTPILEGKLVDLSPDSFINEKDGASFYRAKLVADEASLREQLGSFSLIPGSRWNWPSRPGLAS